MHRERENRFVPRKYGCRSIALMNIQIDDGDTADSPRVMVINEAMATRYWPGGRALGGRVRMGQNTYEVVGIVADAKYGSLNERPVPQMYSALSRTDMSTLRLFVRTGVPPAPLWPSYATSFAGSMPRYRSTTPGP